VAVELVPWVGIGVTSTVGEPAGGSVPVAVVPTGMVPVGTAVSAAATVEVAATVAEGSAATGEEVAVGWDAPWAQAISTSAVNAMRTNQRATNPSDWTG
jgi:hypothetical protein